MNSIKVSLDDPLYNATEDPIAPHKLSLHYAANDLADDARTLPFSVFSHGELGDLSLFPQMPPLQRQSSWDLGDFGYPYETPLVHLSGRMEGAQRPPDYHAYSPPRLDTWEDALQAIEEFDWPTPEETLDPDVAASPLAAESTSKEGTESDVQELIANESKKFQAEPQGEDERPNKRQRFETQTIVSQDVPTPPWDAIPEVIQIKDALHPPSCGHAGSENHASSDISNTGAECFIANVQPEETHDITVADLEPANKVIHEQRADIIAPGTAPHADPETISSTDCSPDQFARPSGPSSPHDAKASSQNSIVHADAERVDGSKLRQEQLQAAMDDGSTDRLSKLLAPGYAESGELVKLSSPTQQILDSSPQSSANDRITMPSNTPDQQQAESGLSTADGVEAVSTDEVHDIPMQEPDFIFVKPHAIDSESLQGKYSDGSAKVLNQALSSTTVTLDPPTLLAAQNLLGVGNEPPISGEVPTLPSMSSKSHKNDGVTESSATRGQPPAQDKSKARVASESEDAKVKTSVAQLKHSVAIKSPKESTRKSTEKPSTEGLQEKAESTENSQTKKLVSALISHSKQPTDVHQAPKPPTEQAAPKPAEIYFEEETRPGDDGPALALHCEEVDVEPPMLDDDYDMQERFTDIQDAPSQSSDTTRTPNRPPKNYVSNRELTALGSTLTPGMHLGLHQQQPKRVRKPTETPAKLSNADNSFLLDEGESSEFEAIHVKKKRTTPDSKKTPASKKAKVETPKSRPSVRAARGIKTEQRSRAEIEDSKEEQHDLFPEPKIDRGKATAAAQDSHNPAPEIALKGKTTIAQPAFDKRHTRSETHSRSSSVSAPVSTAQPDESKSNKRKSLLKNTLARIASTGSPPTLPLAKNKYGFSPRKTKGWDTPAKPKGSVKGKGKKAEVGEDTPTNAAGAKRRGSAVALEAVEAPVTRRKSIQQEKEANIGKRLRSGD
jgi:hypothetical protein